jgi:hypothetical protein
MNRAAAHRVASAVRKRRGGGHIGKSLRHSQNPDGEAKRRQPSACGKPFRLRGLLIIRSLGRLRNPRRLQRTMVPPKRWFRAAFDGGPPVIEAAANA